MTRIRLHLALVALLSLLATACTTTYTRDGVELPDDYVAAIEAQKEQEPIDLDEARIESVVESIPYERGADLLRNLQWLIAQGELAIPKVVEHLDQHDLRTRGHLLYVLGFTRTKESTAALISELDNKDQIVRFEAASGLLNHGDTTAVPVLIDFLNDGDRRFRYKAIESLRKVIGQDFDYEFSAPAEIRNVSITRWRSWWSKEKNRLMNRPVGLSSTQG